MIALSLLLATAPLSPVRAEPVEARGPGVPPVTRPSTSSGRTAEEISPLDAERAFAADAQTLGQWTAFRKWSADDAVMFVPQPVNAHAWLTDRPDPPRAIEWWPTASYVSCDGGLAVNTGGWKRPDGSVGYFTTIWRRQADGGWKWIVDHGDVLSTPRAIPARAVVRRAGCNVVKFTPLPDPPGAATGHAADNSLNWIWMAKPDGSRELSVVIWDGRTFANVIDDEVGPGPK